MANNGKSTRGFFGDYTHYDGNGKKIGTSTPGFFGGYTHYDAKGHKTGSSAPGVFGGYTHYDANGHKTGSSGPGLFGSYDHYSSTGKKTGSSDPTLGGYSHNNSGGCYVATCVYGSYNCPEVWTLRRFRDFSLAQSTIGRAFIRTYYAISPTLVRWFGHTKWFKRMWRGTLDQMVRSLKSSGFEDTPYQDRAW